MGIVSKITHYEKDFPDAYHRLVILVLNQTDEEVYENLESGEQKVRWERESHCNCVIHIYGDYEARKNCVSPLRQVHFKFDPDIYNSLNFIAQAYNYYKGQLTEFRDQ